MTTLDGTLDGTPDEGAGRQLTLGERFRALHRDRDHRRIAALWAVLTVVLVIFALTVPARLMGSPASPTMRAIEDTMTAFSVAAAPVAALVWAIAAYSLFAWRWRGAERPDTDGPPLRGSGPATALWLLASSLLCVFLLIWGLAEIPTVSAAAESPNALVVDVTGQQWVWTFAYPGEGGVESDQLYLPVNRPVVFHVKSDDVIHSFWVVQMGVKVDANPGKTTKASVVPNRLGVFDVRCAELCGLLHSQMQTQVHVVTADQFSTWLSSSRR
ncbi:MAG: cytochrome c oxidase subunit II [Mycobacteriales bacterium]